MNFDKFVDDMVKREKKDTKDKKKIAKAREDNPARKKNKLYGEKWQNSTTWENNK
jgi:hypothetical protein